MRTTRRSGRDREALPEVQEGSRVLPGGPEGVKRPSQRSITGWEDHLEVQEGREAHPVVWKIPPEILEGSLCPLGGPEVPHRVTRGVGRPTRRFGSGW